MFRDIRLQPIERQRNTEQSILRAISEATDPIADEALAIAENLPSDEAQAFVRRVLRNAVLQGIEAVTPDVSRESMADKLAAARSLSFGATSYFGHQTAHSAGSDIGVELRQAILEEALEPDDSQK